MVTLLRVLIDEQGWNDYRTFLSHWRIAAEHEARASGEPGLAKLNLSESTFDRWYTGKARPQHDARRVLARLFDRPITRLLAEPPANQDPVPGTTWQQLHAGAEYTEYRTDPGADLSRMGRQASMAARRAIEFAMGAERNGLGAETLGYLQDEVRRIASAYIRVPLGTILDDLAHLQDQTFRLLEGGRAKPSQIRDLYLLAAIESGLLAKASHDLGDPQSAMMQARTAAVCAEQAEHTPMRAWVRGLQSLVSYWADRPEDALHYARNGAHTASDLTGSVGIWLAGLESRAAAVLGDAETVAFANQRADTLRDRSTPDDLDALGGLFVFPLIRQTYYQVEASVLLGGNDPQLVSRAEEAVRGFSDHADPHWAFGDEAGSQTNLALAHLFAGDIDGASEAVQPVLDLSPDHRNAGIVVSMRRVRSALMQGAIRNAATARELREEITAFASHTPLALPR